MNFRLPLPKNLANARMHWAVKHRAKKAYFRKCDVAQMAGDTPPPPEEPLPRVKLTACLYLWNRQDWDNAVARLKWPIDWLVTRGYVTDDSTQHIEDWSVRQEVDRTDQRVEITLEAA